MNIDDTLDLPVVPRKNQLEIIVKDSGLERTKAEIILTKFQDYFAMAAEWETKARSIVVTKETQTDDMAMAKTGRKLLSARRIEIERTRKELKEQSLRESKAIDGIANVLKGLIIPIEEYLERQEKFVEFKVVAEEQRRLEEAEKLALENEQKRIAAEAAEQARVRAENEKLRKEACEREIKIAEERRQQDGALAAERAKAEAERRLFEQKAAEDQKIAAEAARKHREEIERKAADERRAIEGAARAAAMEAELKRKEAIVKAAKECEIERAKAERERKEKERLETILKNTVKCPHCNKEFQLNQEEDI